MLTKDLLRYRIIGGMVKPTFVKTDNPALLELADQLLSIHDPEQRPTRGEIGEETQPLINGHKDVKLAKGLHKMILDRCEFQHPSDLDYHKLRRAAFAASAAELKSMVENDGTASFRETVARTLETTPIELKEQIYADLPENERLLSIKPTSQRELLERYNVSLVQSILLRNQSLSVKVETPSPVKMRNLLKYLKFFRLLAVIEPDVEGAIDDDESPTRLKMTIDGPASLFENTQKYGLQLASFFPAVCALDKWEIDGEVSLRRQTFQLRLNQKSGLVSHYRHFGDYVPDEIAAFATSFQSKHPQWRVDDNPHFIDAGDQTLIFPDFSFIDADTGQVVHLELFHRWHSTQILQRLERCAEKNIDNLIVGVDRFLHKRPEIQRQMDNSEWFGENGFLFRDFPGADTVAKLLKTKFNVEDERDDVQPELNFGG